LSTPKKLTKTSPKLPHASGEVKIITFYQSAEIIMLNAVKSEVFKAITALLEDKSLSITDDMPLIGGEGLLDSLKLVELCLTLEDIAANLGFEFDWTSEDAMSKSRGMFRTAGALATGFIDQMKAQK
jgi:acyl carrier protein